MSEFTPILLNISEQLIADQLDKMKFLCIKDIGKSRLEKITTGFQLFTALMERKLLGPDNTVFLVSLLENIGRKDLAEIIDGQREFLSNDLPTDEEQEKLEIATKVITENLGRKWKAYGRKLGLKEIKLEYISEKYPSDLEEQVVCLLREWRKIHKAEAKTDTLIRALRTCDQNYTADLIETELEKYEANA